MPQVTHLLPHKKTKSTFLVPTYYKHFQCKGGSCRNTCCAGWTVTIPMNQYHYLLGLNVKKTLRDRLDRTFQPIQQPTKERYAQIHHNYEGNCPLLMKNGWCMLHTECGESVLPMVCRYYPRGPRLDFVPESSMANSCERTLELLFADTNPLQFEFVDLTFDMPMEPCKANQEEQRKYEQIRKSCFQILSNRSVSLPTRISRVGQFMIALDQGLSDGNPTELLDSFTIVKDISLTYQVVSKISEWFIEHSKTIHDWCVDANSFYQEHDIEEKYLQNLTHFETIVPDHKIFFEKMIINNLFFRQFPYQHPNHSFYDEFVSLCGKYIFCRYMAISIMRRHQTIEAFIDILAKTFRVISHTQFDKNIVILLNQQQMTEYHLLQTLLQA
ncbi:MAG: flagellin lysine-N-methylase [bacterium]|nr:flagellin lysine-N-methylase [bacterium]